MSLPRTVVRPDGNLLLLNIDVDPGDAAAMTAVFSPKNYKAGATVDLIVYFHGQHLGSSGTYVPSMTIESYFQNADMSKLLSQVNDASQAATNPRNLLMVAPTLSREAKAGRVATKGMDWYLGEVLDGCFQYGTHKGQAAAPTVKNLILACHSGGGKVMLEAADQAAGTSKPGGNSQGFGSALQECWGFDCLYDDFPVLDMDALLQSALDGKMTAAQAQAAGYDPWKPLPPGAKIKSQQKTLTQLGCETRWRNFSRTTKTPVYMHWFERKVRARNLDLIVKWPGAVVSTVMVFPNSYDLVAGDPPTHVKSQAVNLAGSHDLVPNSYLPQRLKDMKLV